jgi:hypothetical protein
MLALIVGKAGLAQCILNSTLNAITQRHPQSNSIPSPTPPKQHPNCIQLYYTLII